MTAIPKSIIVSFIINGEGVLNLTPQIKIVDTGTNSIVQTGVLTELQDGFYKYVFSSYDPDKNYVFVVDGGAALPQPIRFIRGSNANFVDDFVAVLNSKQPYAGFE